TANSGGSRVKERVTTPRRWRRVVGFTNRAWLVTCTCSVQESSSSGLRPTGWERVATPHRPCRTENCSSGRGRASIASERERHIEAVRLLVVSEKLRQTKSWIERITPRTAPRTNVNSGRVVWPAEEEEAVQASGRRIRANYSTG